MLIFLLSSGLSLIFGLMRVINFSHGSFFMWGSYIGMTVFVAWQNFPLAIFAGLVFGMICGALLERFAIRPFFGNQVQLLLLTLGLMMVLNETVKIFFGPNVHRFPRPAALIGQVSILGWPFPYYRIFIILFGALVLLLGVFFLHKTRYGIILRAGVENPEMVQAFGINIKRVFTLTFSLGVGLASMGGVISGPFLGVYPQLGLDNILVAIIAVVVGGLGSFTGSAVGAIIIGLVNSFGGFYVPQIAMAFNVGLMALVLLLRPQGLFGKGGQIGGR